MSTRWTAPDPHRLPDVRAALLDHYASRQAAASMAACVNAGQATLVPTVPGMNASTGAIAAPLLLAAETRRLQNARLYYASPDMTALALSVAQTPPAEPGSIHRPPSPTGMIMFADPIGGYDRDAAAALAGTPAYVPGASAVVTTPIVAASWSVWTPQEVQLDRGRVVWLTHSGSRVARVPDDWSGLWVTFYSARGVYTGLPEDTVVGRNSDGSPLLVRHLNRTTATGPTLQWDNEALMKDGATFGPAEPDTNAAWLHVLYTAWQLIAQAGWSDLTQTTELHRARSGQKRDARQGITDPSRVRLVDVAAAHRPSRQAAAADRAASTGRRQPSYAHRWPVRPFRRNTCMNPHAHADGACTHEDRPVRGHFRGPQDAPIRPSRTVNTWTSMG